MYASDTTRRIVALTALLAIVAGGAVAAVLACGPFWTDLVTVKSIDPPDPERFAHGDVGVVRPRFRRRHLLQAYRVLSGQTPLREESANDPAVSSIDEWRTIAGPLAAGFSQERTLGNYISFVNCTEGAFSHAVQTYRARAQRFGSSSIEVRDWLVGQVVVFSNCSSQDLRLPAAAPAGANPILRADRDYQIAAAYFYSLQYDEAEKRFRVIGADAGSPWRPYGRFLAARSLIRSVTTVNTVGLSDEARTASEARERARFAVAERDLQATLADSAAAPLHGSARGLLGFLAARTRPVARLHELSATLSRAATVSAQDVKDYIWLMDHQVGDTVEFHLRYELRLELATGDDLTAWIVAMQDTAPNIEPALQTWRARHSPAWLAAVLWHIAPDHAAADELLQAAAAIDRASPSFPTVAFLRVRLLMAQGRADDARAALATLPDEAAGSMSIETVNLLKGARLRLAQSLDEFLANAPREFVITADETVIGRQITRQPVFDGDAGAIFTSKMPLELLVASGESPRLPPRLRARVAGAAFARAVVLQQDALGLRAAAALAAVAPALRSDLQAYSAAADATARHRAGIMTLLRTPGLHLYVRGLDDDVSIDSAGPDRTLDSFRRNWWCERQQSMNGSKEPATEAMRLVYSDDAAPAFPSFLTDPQRLATESERESLDAAGSGRAYLATETLAWAQAEPRNPLVAEALARVVRGWRVGCGDDAKWSLAQRAFQTLHRNFSESEWTKRTPYWYRD